jgi:hypothetical protein
MQVAVRTGNSVGARLPYRERPHPEKQNESEAAARSSHGVVAPGPISKPNVGLEQQCYASFGCLFQSPSMLLASVAN